MNTVKRLAKNTFVLFVSQIITLLFGFFFLMYTSRYLGAEGFGILSFAVAFTGIFGVFGDLGLSVLTVREVARDKSLTAKYLNNVLLMKLLLVILTFGLIVLTINLLGYTGETVVVVYLVGLSVIIASLTHIFYALFQAYEEMEYQSVGQIINSFLLLLIALLIIRQNLGLVGLSSVYLIANSIVLLYALLLTSIKYLKPRFAFDWKFWKPTLGHALPFGLSGIFITMNYWIDSVLLSIFQGEEMVGWYNAAFRMVLFLFLIPGIINTAIFPTMSKFFLQSETSLRALWERYLKFMLLLGFPIGLGTTMLADRFVLFIFGSNYAPSTRALQILIWTIVFSFSSAVFVRLFESTDRQFLVTKIMGVCVLLNILLNLLLIPKFSYLGASFTKVLTEFILLILIIMTAAKIGYNLFERRIITNIVKIVFAGILMGFFIWFFRGWNLFFLVPVAAFLYLGLLMIFKVIDEGDWRLLKQAVRLT